MEAKRDGSMHRLESKSRSNSSIAEEISQVIDSPKTDGKESPSLSRDRSRIINKVQSRSRSESKEWKEEETSRYNLATYRTIHNLPEEVFCVRFSSLGDHLAAGCSDGSIQIYKASSGKLAHSIGGGGLPTTCIRFRPHNSYHKTKDVFLTANAAGTVQHWHMTTDECFHTFTYDENPVFALDYDDNGTKYVTGGKDAKIRIYDESTQQNITTLQGGLLGDYEREAPGHSNRVFSVKFTHDDHILLSGGWDNTVQIWDTREGCAVRSLHGMHICGDALDIKHNEILTGSWRSVNQLELWDFGSGERITEIPWHSHSHSANETLSDACMLYTAQFSKDSAGRFVVAGGSGVNEAKVFDHLSGNALVGTLGDLESAVFSVDFCPDGEKVAIGGGSSPLHIIDICKKRDYYY